LGTFTGPKETYLPAAGRYLAFRCRLPGRPGPRLHVAEAEVILQLETPAPGNCDEVIAALSAAGGTLALS